jgi:hypothetical protein
MFIVSTLPFFGNSGKNKLRRVLLACMYLFFFAVACFGWYYLKTYLKSCLIGFQAKFRSLCVIFDLLSPRLQLKIFPINLGHGSHAITKITT